MGLVMSCYPQNLGYNNTKIDYLSFLLDAHRYSALAYSVLESEGDASELTGVTGAKPGAKVKKVCVQEKVFTSVATKSSV